MNESVQTTPTTTSHSSRLSDPTGSTTAAAPGRLRLRDVRAIFRLVNDVREVGADPQKWRPLMIRRLGKLLRAGIVVSSEVHFRKNSHTGTMRVIDIGWVNEADGTLRQIHTERDDERPEAFWLTAGHEPPAQEEGEAGSDLDELVPVKPAREIYGGTTFILSQVALPHAGAVDQLGLHREWGDEPFTRAEHRLVRLFHVELARLWRRDVLRQAKEPTTDLPPRLAQTLDELLAGSSEKQIAIKLELSRHTIHNYVKALHQRFGVNSRGELLAKAGQIRNDSGPRLSLTLPARAARPKRKPATEKSGRKATKTREQDESFEDSDL
jgi:DNA-binding CsgD family transcriptional regulator